VAGMVYAGADSGSWPERDSPEWDATNRALAMPDTLACTSTRRSSIASHGFLGPPFRRIRGPAKQFMNLRGDDNLIWPSLRARCVEVADLCAPCLDGGVREATVYRL
jgi:hypothetical protein